MTGRSILAAVVGAAAAASAGGCSGDGPTGPTVSPIGIHSAYVSRDSQYILLRQDGAPLVDAEVRVNGEPVAYAAAWEGYVSNVQVQGAVLKVVARSRGAVLKAAAAIPDVPAITAPAPGASLDGAADVSVEWAASADPTLQFLVWGVWSTGGQQMGSTAIHEVAPSARRYAIPGGSIPAGPARIQVEAMNRGTFSGDFDATPGASYLYVSSGRAAVDVTLR